MNQEVKDEVKDLDKRGLAKNQIHSIYKERSERKRTKKNASAELKTLPYVIN